jgi:hypothetical protein
MATGLKTPNKAISQQPDGSAPLTPSSYENAGEGVAKPRD